MVWEPRHPNWFGYDANAPLNEFEISRVAAGPACVPVAAEPAGLARLTYFRLHGFPGLYYSLCSDAFLAKLGTPLSNLELQARTWCIFDNTANGASACDALKLVSNVRTPPIRNDRFSYLTNYSMPLGILVVSGESDYYG